MKKIARWIIFFFLEMTAAVLSRANERINCDKKSEMKRFRCLESINDYTSISIYLLDINMMVIDFFHRK